MNGAAMAVQQMTSYRKILVDLAGNTIELRVVDELGTSSCPPGGGNR